MELSLFLPFSIPLNSEQQNESKKKKHTKLSKLFWTLYYIVRASHFCIKLCKSICSAEPPIHIIKIIEMKGKKTFELIDDQSFFECRKYSILPISTKNGFHRPFFKNAELMIIYRLFYCVHMRLLQVCSPPLWTPFWMCMCMCMCTGLASPLIQHTILWTAPRN